MKSRSSITPSPDLSRGPESSCLGHSLCSLMPAWYLTPHSVQWTQGSLNRDLTPSNSPSWEQSEDSCSLSPFNAGHFTCVSLLIQYKACRWVHRDSEFICAFIQKYSLHIYYEPFYPQRWGTAVSRRTNIPAPCGVHTNKTTNMLVSGRC